MMPKGRFGTIDGQAVNEAEIKLSGTRSADFDVKAGEEVTLIVRGKIETVKHVQPKGGWVKQMFVKADVCEFVPDSLIGEVAGFLDDVEAARTTPADVYEGDGD